MIIDPQRGGVVRAYVTTARGWQRNWFAPDNGTHPACFPMVPFCSRIAEGRFSFGSRHVQLPPNNLPEPHAIHGHGFQRAWQVLEFADDAITLGYEYEPGDWPWPYQAVARYSLRGADLEVELSVQNLSDEVMPAGLGLHPYFPRGSQTLLQAHVSEWLQLDDALLPVDIVDLPEALDLPTGLALADDAFDHVFLGWNGRARLRTVSADGEQDLLIHSSAPYLVVWAPSGQDFVCVEGLSNLPDAFNRDVGFERVEPRAVHRVRWRFSPQFG